LGESETVVLDVVPGPDVAGDRGLGDLEGNTGRRGSLDVESGAVNGKSLLRRSLEVFPRSWKWKKAS
jgi:hypothetical protein